MTYDYALWVLQKDADEPELKDRDEEFARQVWEAKHRIRKGR